MIATSKIFLILVVFLFSFSAITRRAFADQAFTVDIKKDGQDVGSTSSQKWSFITVNPEVYALFAVITIDAPSGARFKSISGNHALIKDGWIKPNQAQIALGAMKTDLDIEFEGGRRETWTAEVILSKTVLLLKGCKKSGLNVTTSSKQSSPIFFGAVCTSKKNNEIFNPSVPGDVEWGLTTIFETSGKGERWKVFEVSKNNLIAGNNVFGVFGFNWNDQKLSFNLVQARKKGGEPNANAKKKSEMFRSRVDFGAAQFSGKTINAQTSSIGPYVAANILTPEVLWGLRALGSIRYAFPLSKGSFSEINGGIGSVFGSLNPGTSNYGIFADYVALNQSQEDATRNISLQHSQPGIALMWINAMKDSDLSVTVKYHGAGDGSGYRAELAYEGLFGGPQRWGAVLYYASQSAKSLTSGTSTFNQMSLAASLSF